MISRVAVYLITIHVLITMAGLLLHLKAHYPSQSLFYWWAAPVSLFNLVVVSGLYLGRRTVAWGVLLNHMTVAVGLIGMSYFTIKTLPSPITPSAIVLRSTVPFSLLLVKIPLALLILKEVGAQKIKVGNHGGS